MPFSQPDRIRYFTFESLNEVNVTHAVFTRRGGTSPHPWASLNVGGLVGDDPERVMENKQLSLLSLGRPVESIYDVWQVHSRDVVCTDAPRLTNVPHLKADAILTDRPGVTLFMRFADCVPVLLSDPKRGVVGLAHAGWMGTVRRTTAAAVEAMVEQYHSNPADIIACIGPSIGVHHYEVGPEVADKVRNTFGTDAPSLLLASNGGEQHVQFDLWAANRLILGESGVKHIEVAELCTACHLDDWYSHRGEAGKTGRFGVIIGL